jgi:hypothetical protein
MFIGGMDEEQDANEIAQQNGQRKDDQVLSEYRCAHTILIAFLNFCILSKLVFCTLMVVILTYTSPGQV